MKTYNEDNKLSQEESDAIIELKRKKTEDLLGAYKTCADSGKHTLAENYQKVAKSYNYKDDYVAVNEHSGSDLVPVFNNLMMVSDMRSYEIQQIDYKHRFRIFNNLGENINDFNEFINIINEIENNCITFVDKMKYIYSLNFDSKFMKLILDNLEDSNYAKYYYSISKERASALKYQKGNLEKEYRDQKIKLINTDQIIEEIKGRFKPGERYSKVFIKSTLKDIYESNGYNKTPKASDLEEYFEIKLCKILNESTGKRDMAFEIIKIKGEGD